MEEQEVLELLRTPGLSIKNLDPAKREELRAYIIRKHIEQGVSLSDIAKLIGSKTSGYTSWLTRQLGIQPRAFEEARLKGIHEKVRKYERKPFDGTDEDKAYLFGLRYGNLSVSCPFGDAVRVSTSTTHPAMSHLFESLFSPYGHVYRHPRHKKDTDSYEWNLSTILDSSFAFLMRPIEDTLAWVEQSESLTLAFLSGLLDAEGSIVITNDQSDKVALFVDYNNSDKPLLEWVRKQLVSKGFYCSIRINKKKGEVTKKWGIIHRKDYWQLSSYGMDRVKKLIERLGPRHDEKVRRKQVAMSVNKGQDFASVSDDIEALRAQIKQEVKDFVKEAERLFKENHPLLDTSKEEFEGFPGSQSKGRLNP